MSSTASSEYKKYPIMRNFDQSSSLGFVLLKNNIDISIDEVLSFEFMKDKDGQFMMVGVGLVDGVDYCKFLEKRHLIYGMPKSKIVKEEPVTIGDKEELSSHGYDFGKIPQFVRKLLTKLSKPDSI